MSGYVGGVNNGCVGGVGRFGNGFAFILVLFILLVIIACSCGFFGGGFGY